MKQIAHVDVHIQNLRRIVGTAYKDGVTKQMLRQTGIFNLS